MKRQFTMLNDITGSREQSGAGEFARDVLRGLTSTPKRLSSKYFYDKRGSELFSRIMELPEYYLTNAELEILSTHGKLLAELCRGESFDLIELGAGDGRKTSVLLKQFVAQHLEFEYVPIDISRSAVEQLTSRLLSELPSLNVNGLVTEYFSGMRWMNRSATRKKIVLFLGSNIGNFTLAEAREFLSALRNTMKDGDLLILGMDLEKDPEVLLAAYSDSQGVTREFNLNLLERINRELGGNFTLENFEHCARYNADCQAMESYLFSLKKQAVELSALSRSFTFGQGEPIHMEYSMKYSEDQIEALAADSGFRITRNFFDSRRYFVDSVWEVAK